MTEIKNICVFCGASSDVDQIYKDVAQQTAQYCIEHGFDIVYGGASVGLMGIVADTALAGGVQVTGVIPEHLKARELAHEGLSTLHVTQTMQERQKLMAELSDAFIILPGGLGTLAEFFEIVTWKQLGLHDKPIVILNKNKYWQPLIDMMSHMSAQGFSHSDFQELFVIVDGPQDLSSCFIRA